MKRHTLVLFSLLATGTVSAKEVVSTQGDSYSNTSGRIDFTLGEVIIAQNNNTGVLVFSHLEISGLNCSKMILIDVNKTFFIDYLTNSNLMLGLSFLL